MDNGMENMLDMYLFETNSLLEQLDEILLNAESASNFSEDDVQEIFRIMHTIKGSSAMMQFNSIMSIAHRIEDLFFQIRESGIKEELQSDLFNLMFKSNDLLKIQVEKIQRNESLDENIDDFTAEIDGILLAFEGGEMPPQDNNNPAPLENKSLKDDDSNHHVRVYFDEGCGMENLRSYMLANAVRDVVEDFSFQPKDVETNPSTSDHISEHGFVMSFKDSEDTNSAISIIKSALNIRTYEEIQLSIEEVVPQMSEIQNPKGIKKEESENLKVQEPSANVPVVANVVTSGTSPTKQNLISVNLTKLDSLMNIVGEIIMTESMVTSSPDLKGLKLDSFTKSARQLGKLTSELQDTVMSIRMVPVSGVFQKMNRIVRDMNQGLGKDVKLTTIGADTEVDKTIVDSIGDPIMHMVRNSMDHGIETNVDERLALGKPAQGEIVLMAHHTAGEVVITIKDDGRGVNVDDVLEKAKNQNLLIKPESEYTKKDILQLLLLPGFSTKEKVTEFSGRGVGMDVVKKNIEKVGGVVSISSEEGEGTTTTFKIPLTLAIVGGMEVAVGKSIFIIPIINIRQSFKISNEDVVYDADRGEMVRRMDTFYPIIRLHDLYQVEGAVTEIENGIIIWVEAGDDSYCLFVDELLGEQPVVVKPLPAYLNSFNIKDSGIAGCTILGDGNISIILDATNLKYAASNAL